MVSVTTLSSLSDCPPTTFVAPALGVLAWVLSWLEHRLRWLQWVQRSNQLEFELRRNLRIAEIPLNRAE